MNTNRYLFLYTSGREKRIALLKNDEAPVDFLYGYSFVKEKGADVDYLETDLMARKKASLEYWVLLRKNKKFARYIGIGNRSHYYVGIIDYLNRFNVLIATTDSIALGLLHHKMEGCLQPKVVYLNMGLGGVLERSKNSGDSDYELKRELISEYFRYCSTIISVGRGEYNYFRNDFPEHRDKFRFIPFGIDVHYWSPNSDTESAINQPYFLFAGNDLNRDYELLLTVIRECPNTRFVLATSRIRPEDCPKNAILKQGHLQTDVVTDSDLRRLYRGCLGVLILLNQTVQPSGQTVALQGMSCECPIILTATKGLWDPASIVTMENCILVEPNSKKDVVSVIEDIETDPGKYAELSRNARSTVVAKYSAERFAETMWELIIE